MEQKEEVAYRVSSLGKHCYLRGDCKRVLSWNPANEGSNEAQQGCMKLLIKETNPSAFQLSLNIRTENQIYPLLGLRSWAVSVNPRSWLAVVPGRCPSSASAAASVYNQPEKTQLI